MSSSPCRNADSKKSIASSAGVLGVFGVLGEVDVELDGPWMLFFGIDTVCLGFLDLGIMNDEGGGRKERWWLNKTCKGFIPARR